MVRDLHDVHPRYRTVSQPGLELLELRVSGEERAKLSKLDKNSDG